MKVIYEFEDLAPCYQFIIIIINPLMNIPFYHKINLIYKYLANQIMGGAQKVK
jgi:hypothetical protein